MISRCEERDDDIEIPIKFTYPLINLSAGLALADNPEKDRGKFVCYHRSEGIHCYEAIVNTEERFYTEVFYSYDEAREWLDKQERNDD